MKRILLSLAIIVAASSSALAAGGTGAFLSDTESSIGNLFTAGAIDLKVDNHSFYNGNECKEVTAGIFQWVGTAGFPIPGTPCTTSWSLDDLTNGQGVTIHKFFDFQDIKPSDYSEDTISLHVNGNDSYLCADVKLTSNDENSCTGPELKDEPGCTSPGLGQGQLAQNVNFIWWADLNGDNVLEDNEKVISSGPIGALTLGATTTVPLADSNGNIWNPGGTGGPVAGNSTKYIGKAWCFGTITAAPLASSTFVAGPAGDNNSDGKFGTPEDGGYHCDGTALNNSTQTDSLTADVTFNAVQARHNDKFVCTPPTTANLTLVKVVDNTGGGTHLAHEWTLSATGPSSISGLAGDPAVTNASVNAGTYTLGESGPSGYTASHWSCVVNGGAPVDEASGQITLAVSDVATCTITNMHQVAHLTVTKIVNNIHGGNNVVPDFHLFVEGSAANTTGVTSGVQATLSPDTYSVSETGVSGYVATFSGDCDSEGNVTLNSGDNKACTITNTDLPANITLIKIVDVGAMDPATFKMRVDGILVPNTTSIAVTSNANHFITEDPKTGYHFVSITGAGCPSATSTPVVLNEGQALTCTIHNAQNAI